LISSYHKLLFFFPLRAFSFPPPSSGNKLPYGVGLPPPSNQIGSDPLSLLLGPSHNLSFPLDFHRLGDKAVFPFDGPPFPGCRGHFFPFHSGKRRPYCEYPLVLTSSRNGSPLHPPGEQVGRPSSPRVRGWKIPRSFRSDDNPLFSKREERKESPSPQDQERFTFLIFGRRAFPPKKQPLGHDYGNGFFPKIVLSFPQVELQVSPDLPFPTWRVNSSHKCPHPTFSHPSLAAMMRYLFFLFSLWVLPFSLTSLPF